MKTLYNKGIVPYLPLEEYMIDRDTATLFSKAFCIKHAFICIDKFEDTILTVAMADPNQSDVIKQVEEKMKCKVFAFLSPIEDITKKIQYHFKRKGDE